ncbi:MAG TPA: isoamylase early set domain-containing protein [Deltaproteobacteria bacterium]|jgi:1,4-alpha-glucan branching enzyme|nr:isoamylase early set domain-containing protein [Deltaproteobacteria bacterium]OQC27967.1 MAG: glycogen branching enzyme [Deltaproteobacteria bacterium ADurb.Bin072]HRW81561.1 isoamylase early set domain-containing protein [Desulfomonilia bacterium]NMD40058.1 glycoside hydrolase [Deltaproteobacteria bacterium]HNQ86074.1 isoamylase early set domain-containing protein [Deltaproteobacteria bacterium]
MSIKKQYLKTKPECKVTFTLSRDMSRDAGSVYLVGDFNGWDAGSHPMKLHKDGSFNLTINLEKGREYQFRYLIDGCSWENDDCADRYVGNPYGDSENSVVVIEGD